MSPPDIPPVPTNIPDDLWFDIQRVRRRLASFIADAQLSVRDDEARTGQHDISFYAWLEPLAKAVTELRKAKRHAPSAANVIAFPQKREAP